MKDKWRNIAIELPNQSSWYLCYYRGGKKKYAVLWFDQPSQKWYSQDYGVGRYDRYGVKTVMAWKELIKPDFVYKKINEE